MMAGIFNIIMALVLKVTQLVLIPIDYMIYSLLPTLSDALTAIGTLLVLLTQGIGWAISVSGIPYSAIAFVATAMIFRLTIPFYLWMVKLALSWYQTLKP